MTVSPVTVHSDLNALPDFAREVARGLAARPRAVAPKFFYDRRGSELFDAICRLPEYYLTRTELAILEAHAGAIARHAANGGVMIELGSGASVKVRLLLEALRPRAYLAIDICRDFLKESAERLAQDYPWLEVHAACADFSLPFGLPALPEGPRLVFFPGSSIGNLNPDEAAAFLARLRPLVGVDGTFLLGVDLKKDARRLDAAYNDGAGLTAEFNRNLLARLRRDLGAEVDLGAFVHEAIYNERLGRIEMYLVSLCDQDIRVNGRSYRFAAGERLHTEHSYKYALEDFRSLAAGAGYALAGAWTDPARDFAVCLLRPEGSIAPDPSAG